MTARRVCAEPGCPVLVDTGRCKQHERQVDRARGTRQQRGYDRDYDQARREAASRVATGLVKCWRCRRPLDPSQPWHLGHDDHDRSIIRGPECVPCNLSAAGRASHTQ